MTWAPILLASPSPSLRLLVLRDLLHREGTDEEICELQSIQDQDPFILKLLALQEPDGSFRSGEGGGSHLGKLRTTAQALMGLGYMGLNPKHEAVQRGAEFLFKLQNEDGSWSLPSGRQLDGGAQVYTMIPLQTSLPLLGLAICGYATDSRAEKAYEWLLKRQLPDGGWPSGEKAGKMVFAAGYRRLSHTKWGCRTNTTAAVSAFAFHPKYSTDSATHRGLDLLLAHETRQTHTLGFEVARIIGIEPLRGAFTYYQRYDVAQILDLCWRIGATLEDPRIRENIDFVKELQGPYGLWEYPTHPEASHWITFDLLRSLSQLDTEGEWVSLEPRTRFKAYPKRKRRY
ncbi:MAG: prenyltransferase/squalene oxidase repeat-containing protein [Promethearchaeota archaeon]